MRQSKDGMQTTNWPWHTMPSWLVSLYKSFRLSSSSSPTHHAFVGLPQYFIWWEADYAFIDTVRNWKVKFSLIMGGERVLDENLRHALRSEAMKETDGPTCKAICHKGWCAQNHGLGDPYGANIEHLISELSPLLFPLVLLFILAAYLKSLWKWKGSRLQGNNCAPHNHKLHVGWEGLWGCTLMLTDD
jgi:hypothetical protein